MKKRLSKEEWVSSEELFSTSYLTFDKIRYFCKDIKWIDSSKAIDLYLFYCKCVSMQETKQVFCSVRFAAEWMWRTTDTITKYRNALEEVWCVENICKRDEKWKVLWWYVKVKFAIPCTTKAPSGFDPDLGGEGQNTGGYKDKILDDKKEKICKKDSEDTNAPDKIENKEKKDAFEEIRKSFPHPRTSNKKTSFENYMNNSASVDDIKKEIDLLNVEYFHLLTLSSLY